MLFVSGSLDLKKTGGPSTDFADDNYRRTVYCKISRYRLDNFLQVFDYPNPSFTAEQRFTTNVPLQRLYFMNSSFVYKQAETFAKRVYDEEGQRATRRDSESLSHPVWARAERSGNQGGPGFLAGPSGSAGRTGRGPANHGLE